MVDLYIRKDVAEKYPARLPRDIEAIPSKNGYCLLTPFIKPDGEAIGLEIVSLSGGDFRISDMGDTMGYLYVNGLMADIAAPDYAASVAGVYGVSWDGNVLSVECCADAVGGAVHNLIQCILAITGYAQCRNNRSRAYRRPFSCHSPPP